MPRACRVAAAALLMLGTACHPLPPPQSPSPAALSRAELLAWRYVLDTDPARLRRPGRIICLAYADPDPASPVRATVLTDLPDALLAQLTSADWIIATATTCPTTAPSVSMALARPPESWPDSVSYHLTYIAPPPDVAAGDYFLLLTRSGPEWHVISAKIVDYW